MFTGIIETLGTVKSIITNGSNKSFWIHSPISSELRKDQSVSHNGVCLTVDELDGQSHRVTAIQETLEKSNLLGLKEGSFVNLERCLKMNDRLDGHIVQGHVDATGRCTRIKSKKGSWEIEIRYPGKMAALLVEKGSVCVNGISLTAFNVKRKKFTVAIIPFTYENTNIQYLREGDDVNLEFDLVGKYLLRTLSLSKGSIRK